MITKTFKATLLSILLICSSSVMANKHKPTKSTHQHHDKARVIHVEPHFIYTNRYEKCHRAQVHSNRHRSSTSHANTLVGSAVGGLLGHQHSQRKIHQHACYGERPRHYKQQQGYDVTYRYHGKIHHTHLYYRPGKYIPVEVRVRPLTRHH